MGLLKKSEPTPRLHRGVAHRQSSQVANPSRETWETIQIQDQ
jgi:hypothetical protein